MSANRGLRRARFTTICAAAASLTLAFSPGAHAAQPASQHKIAMPQAGSVKPFAPLANLAWGGGPVEHGTKVYLVFWGSQWTADRNGVQAYLQNYFSGLGNGSERWSNVMNQYTDSSGHASNGNPVFGGSWVDSGVTAPANGSATAISNEANRGATHFGVSGANADVFVVSPSGAHRWCRRRCDRRPGLGATRQVNSANGCGASRRWVQGAVIQPPVQWLRTQTWLRSYGA